MFLYLENNIGNIKKFIMEFDHIIEKKFLSEDGRIHHGKKIDEKDNFTVIECEYCGFTHVIPIPEQEELEKLYEDEYYSSDKPLTFKETEEDRSWWELHYNFYYELIEKNLKLNSKKLLDIGSGPGLFLKVGKKRGWNVTGFEPSIRAYQCSKKFGLNIINDFFDVKTALEDGAFDVVSMFNVIEHLADPKSIIKDVKSVLKERGLFCIIAPNDYNPLQNTLKKNLNVDSYWLEPPEHLNYFNFHSVKKLLEELDFEVINSLATFPMEFFILNGKNYLNNEILGHKCHVIRKNFEMNLAKNDKNLLYNFFSFLAENEIGREFVILARLN